MSVHPRLRDPASWPRGEYTQPIRQTFLTSLKTHQAGQLAGRVAGAVLEVDVGAGGHEDVDTLLQLLMARDVQRRPSVVVNGVDVGAPL